jgi:peptide deformylase
MLAPLPLVSPLVRRFLKPQAPSPKPSFSLESPPGDALQSYVKSMTSLSDIDIPSLALLKYPDPRLRQPCGPVEQFDERLRALVAKMFSVMYEHNGVGLAAPQVGVGLCIFIANASHEADGERVYINPHLISSEGSQDGEEGCLSFPGIYCRIKRAAITTIRAQDLQGNVFEETGEGLLARAFQHEYDHLQGRLLIDRMSPVAKMAHRRALKSLEEAAAS